MPAVWTIKRNCSASPRLLAGVLASVAAVSFVIGVAFASVGLWLVLPFVGLEIAAVVIAFMVYARHAADWQRISLDGGDVLIEQVSAATRSATRWPAAWTRLEADADAARLWLARGAERIEIGQHLAAARRVALAAELRQALRLARTHESAAAA